MARLIFFLCFIVLGLCSCKKKIVENRLIGEWQCEYELLEDGTKDYADQYALLDWNYSDGFILYKDGTCQSTWLGVINSDKIEWSNSKDLLTIHVPRSNGEIEDFEYFISDVKKNSMFMEYQAKGYKYYLNKK